MAKKTQDLKPDTVLKNYWSNNEQFADLFNAVLFQGKQIIKPDELEEMDTEESIILEHKEYSESIQASRDSIKIQKKSSKHGVQMVLFGLENQECIHYAMPMRVMGLDYAAYKKQYDNNAKKYKNNAEMDGDEYLSRMKKADKFVPVITVVVYYGEKHVDLFNLLGILLDKSKPLKETKDKAIDYTKKHTVDKSVVMTVAGAVNCKIDYNALDRKGDADMCTVFEEIAKESENIGEIRGTIKTYKELDIPEDVILEKIKVKFDLSEQDAEEYMQSV